MPLDPKSYLPEFFTEERLARYRELSERFPLWCGRWPEGLVVPQAWQLETRIGETVGEVASYVDLFPLAALNVKGRSGLLLGELEHEESASPHELSSGKPMTAPLPSLHESLLRAIELTELASSSTTTLPYANWAERVRQALEAQSSEYAYDLAAKGPVPVGKRISGVEILSLRRRAIRERDPVAGERLRDAWVKVGAGRLSGLAPKRGRGWHSLRRKFALDLMDQPLKVLSELGGWKSLQTVLSCYQHPDQEQLRGALLSRGLRTETGE